MDGWVQALAFIWLVAFLIMFGYGLAEAHRPPYLRRPGTATRGQPKPAPSAPPAPRPPRADSLPVGTWVVYQNSTIERVGNIALKRPWYGGDGKKYTNYEIDILLANGGQLLPRGAKEHAMTNADIASRTDRGDCPVCRRSMQLKKDGTMRAHVHQDMLGGSHLSPYGGRCEGSGQKPKEG